MDNNIKEIIQNFNYRYMREEVMKRGMDLIGLNVHPFFLKNYENIKSLALNGFFKEYTIIQKSKTDRYASINIPTSLSTVKLTFNVNLNKCKYDILYVRVFEDDGKYTYEFTIDDNAKTPVLSEIEKRRKYLVQIAMYILGCIEDAEKEELEERNISTNSNKIDNDLSTQYAATIKETDDISNKIYNHIFNTYSANIEDEYFELYNIICNDVGLRAYLEEVDYKNNKPNELASSIQSICDKFNIERPSDIVCITFRGPVISIFSFNFNCNFESKRINIKNIDTDIVNDIHLLRTILICTKIQIKKYMNKCIEDNRVIKGIL